MKIKDTFGDKLLNLIIYTLLGALVLIYFLVKTLA